MKSIQTFFIALVGGLIPELALSYIVMKLMDESWSVFFITYIAIQLFYFIVWFFRSLINWFLYRVFWKRQFVEEFYESLINRKYPNQDYHIVNSWDAETYFEEIFSDSEIRAETRIHAASICTRFNVLKELGKVQ